jgi:hypothetical protein
VWSIPKAAVRRGPSLGQEGRQAGGFPSVVPVFRTCLASPDFPDRRRRRTFPGRRRPDRPRRAPFLRPAAGRPARFRDPSWARPGNPAASQQLSARNWRRWCADSDTAVRLEPNCAARPEAGVQEPQPPDWSRARQRRRRRGTKLRAGPACPSLLRRCKPSPARPFSRYDANSTILVVVRRPTANRHDVQAVSVRELFYNGILIVNLSGCLPCRVSDSDACTLTIVSWMSPD